jgi:hypothetical protein
MSAPESPTFVKRKAMREEALGVGEQGLDRADRSVQEDVVIVSGLPRSGTSMMMQMLAAGVMPVLTDGTRAADEDNPRGYFELEKVRRLREDAGWLDGARGHTVKIVSHLLSALPPDRTYRILFMERPMGEILKSQTAMLERTDPDGRRTPHHRMATVYRDQLAGIRRVLLAHEERISILGVPYHAVLEDPGAAAARVNGFLGGTLDERAMAAAVDPALRRQGTPVPPG